MKEQAAESVTQAGAAVGGIVHLFLAAMDPIATAIFGIPSQALLAAGAGVFFGRTFLPSTGFRGTLAAWFGWTLASCYSLPLLLHIAGVPQGVVASVAFALGLGLQLFAPVLIPVLIARAPDSLRGWLDKRFGANGGQQ